MSGWHVIFGTGPLGIALMRALRADDLPVRMLNRSGHVPFEKDPQTQVGGIDAANPVHTREVCEGAAAVYHCVGLPYTAWDRLPAIADGIIEGAASAQAPLVYGDNLYMYGEVVGPIHEDLPDAATGRKGRLRAQLAQRLLGAHRAGKVAIAIGRGSDFFGPHATRNAEMGSRVFGRALAGRAAQLIGNPDRLHTFTYLPDFAATLKALALRPESHGRVWHVPSPPALTSRAFVEQVFRAAGRRPRLVSAPALIVRALGIFDRNMKELVEVLYQFDRNFVMDSSRFESTFGIAPTPLDQAIAETLDWFRNNGDEPLDLTRRRWATSSRA